MVFRQNVFDSGFLAGVCAEGGGARPILVENTFSGGDPTSQVPATQEPVFRIIRGKIRVLTTKLTFFASRLKVP
jgi:hypothetical protein